MHYKICFKLVLLINVNFVIQILELVKLNSKVNSGFMPQRSILVHIKLVKPLM